MRWLYLLTAWARRRFRLKGRCWPVHVCARSMSFPAMRNYAAVMEGRMSREEYERSCSDVEVHYSCEEPKP